MPCTEAYKEHIMHTFNGFCKTVIRFADINAWHDRSRRRQKEMEGVPLAASSLPVYRKYFLTANTHKSVCINWLASSPYRYP